MLFQQRSHPTWYHHVLTHLGALTLLGLTLFLAACGGSSPTTTSGGTTGTTCPSTKSLTGAGSTFDYPPFSKMFTEYPNVKCGANVNYQSVGSGAGINDLLNTIVAFGATDTPLTDAQIAKSTHGTILHIPVTLGAEAISYNLSGIPSGTLKLTGPIIADIYLGKIKTWNDPAITKINTGITLPSQNITVVHRSDGSGTTGIFTHYLSDVSSDWSSKVGAGTTVNWPVGVGGKGNAGVALAERPRGEPADTADPLDRATEPPCAHPTRIYARLPALDTHKTVIQPPKQ
jgi:phosphate transport system substrate-binding protein